MPVKNWDIANDIGWLIEFQSLFYWMPVKNPEDVGHPITPKYGFNPCFIGCRSKTDFCGEKHVFIQEFQSLFYWMPVKNQLGQSDC